MSAGEIIELIPTDAQLPSPPRVLVPYNRDYSNHNARDGVSNVELQYGINALTGKPQISGGVLEEKPFIDAVIGHRHLPLAIEQEHQMWIHDDTYMGKPIDWVADKWRGIPLWGAPASVRYPHPFGTCRRHDPTMPLYKLPPGYMSPYPGFYNKYLASVIGYPGRTESVWVPWAAFHESTYAQAKAATNAIAYMVITPTFVRPFPGTPVIIPWEFEPGKTEYVNLNSGSLYTKTFHLADHPDLIWVTQRQRDGLVDDGSGTQYFGYITNDPPSPIDPGIGGTVGNRQGTGWHETAPKLDGPIYTTPPAINEAEVSDYAEFSTSYYDARGYTTKEDYNYYRYSISLSSKEGYEYATPGGIAYENKENTAFKTVYVSGGELDPYLEMLVDPVMTRDADGRRWPPVFGELRTDGEPNWGTGQVSMRNADEEMRLVAEDGLNIDDTGAELLLYARKRLYLEGHFKGVFNWEQHVRSGDTMAAFNSVFGGTIRMRVDDFFSAIYRYPYYLGTRRFMTTNAYRTPNGGLTFNRRKAFDMYDEWCDSFKPKKDRGKAPLGPCDKRPLGAWRKL